MKSFKNRYKPVGWRGDSYRHYLAAKGIKTKVKPHKYFVRDFLKGNRMPKLVAIGHAKGFSDTQLQDESLLRRLAVRIPASRRNDEIAEAIAYVANGNKKSELPLPEDRDLDFKERLAERDKQFEDFESTESFDVIDEEDLPTVESSTLEESQIPIDVDDASIASADSANTSGSIGDPGEVVMTPGVPGRSSLSFDTGDQL